MPYTFCGLIPCARKASATLGGMSESYRSTQIAAAAFRYPALRWWNPTGVMSASSCSTDVPAIFSGVHPNATSRAVAACVMGSFVCEESIAETRTTKRRPRASSATSSEIFSHPIVSTGAPPTARMRLN